MAIPLTVLYSQKRLHLWTNPFEFDRYHVYMPFEIRKMATKPPVITLKELCSRARVGKFRSFDIVKVWIGPYFNFIHVGEDTPVVNKSLQVRSIPGLYSVVSSEKVRAALKRIGFYVLKPVHMKPSTNYKTLDDALSVTSDDGDSLAFSEICKWLTVSLKVTIIFMMWCVHTRSIFMRSTSTWSTLMRSTFHEINSYEINFSWNQLLWDQ